MKLETLREIVNCLPRERTLFRYFKDRYALMLLYHFIGDGMEVRQIRNSHMASLLQKPVVRDFLSYAGEGRIYRRDLLDFWMTEMYHFVLTLGLWGGRKNRGYYQTSRSGYNLVLQLNFSNEHDHAYHTLVRPRYQRLLNYHAHPVNRQVWKPYLRETLAWARIDLDFATDEALIEEVQSDWVRRAKSMLAYAKRYAHEGHVYIEDWHVQGCIDDVVKYCEEVLAPYQKIWSEAMLAATVDFIRNELGIRTIYYHTDTTGHRLKKIKWTQPPRSLYYKLPRQFCFGRTNDAPDFLLKDKTFCRMYKKISRPEWFRMEL